MRDHKALVVAILALSAGCLSPGAAPPEGGGDPPTVLKATYFGVGVEVFEPSIVSTSDGTLLISAAPSTLDREAPETQADQGSRILRSRDGMNWEEVTPRIGPVNQIPRNFDPLIVIDPWTDRVFRFENAANCQLLQWTDNTGDSWSPPVPVCADSPVLQDHQTLAAYPPPESVETNGYPNVLTYCVFRGLESPTCSSSVDGGLRWGPMVPGVPQGESACGNNHGQMVGHEGVVYRPGLGCDGATVWRSLDAGATWTEHVIGGSVLGHDVGLAVDAAGGVHAFWIGSDGEAYLASSEDRGESWEPTRRVTAPGITAAGFPAIAAGSAGRIAFTYIGTTQPGGYGSQDDQTEWDGFIGLVMDVWNRSHAATVQVNEDDDPLHVGRCGDRRCPGFGDFVGITVDPAGRPWAALAWTRASTVPFVPGAESGTIEGPVVGIAATLAEGPSLRGGGALAPLPMGGAATR